MKTMMMKQSTARSLWSFHASCWLLPMVVAASVTQPEHYRMRGRGIRSLAALPKKQQYSYESEEDLFPDMPHFQTEADFVEDCLDWFLTEKDDDDDNMITQDDFGNFLERSCTILDDEDLPSFGCPFADFSDLQVDVQLLFVKEACKGEDNQLTCLEELKNISTFGYSTTNERALKPIVEEWCCSLLPFTKKTRLDVLSGDECQGFDTVSVPSLPRVTATPSVALTERDYDSDDTMSPTITLAPSPDLPPAPVSPVPTFAPTATVVPSGNPTTTGYPSVSPAPSIVGGAAPPSDNDTDPSLGVEPEFQPPVLPNTGNAQENVSVGATVAIALGAGVLLLGLVTSRRLFQRGDDPDP